MGVIVTDGRFKWDGTNGGRLQLWKVNVSALSTLVSRYKLKPVTPRTVISGLQSGGRAAPRLPRFPRFPFPGIPIPHIHYNAKIYPVNAAQWKQFSTGVKKNLQAKIGRMSTVKFEELAGLAEVTAKIR